MSVDIGDAVNTSSVKVVMEECSTQALIETDISGHAVRYEEFSCGLRSLVFLAQIEDLACFLDKSSIYAPKSCNYLQMQIKACVDSVSHMKHKMTTKTTLLNEELTKMTKTTMQISTK